MDVLLPEDNIYNIYGNMLLLDAFYRVTPNDTFTVNDVYFHCKCWKISHRPLGKSNEQDNQNTWILIKNIV